MKYLATAVAVLALVGLGALADVSRGTGNPANASLGVSVGWDALNWVILYIPTTDMAVDLGTVTPDLYDPVTDTWTALIDAGGPRSVYVITNADGFQLQISGTLSLYPTDHPNPDGILDRLTLTSTDLGVSAAALSGTITYLGSRGLFLADDIVYQFTPSFDDVPGAYAVTVTYTVTTR